MLMVAQCPYEDGEEALLLAQRLGKSDSTTACDFQFQWHVVLP